MEKKIKTGKLYRSFMVDVSTMNDESRTVELSFSSDTPCERSFGMEILDHSPQSVDLTRLSTVGNLLCDHDPVDVVGVIESTSISNGKGNAVCRFGRSTRANEVYTDVKDGIRKGVSVGYYVNEMVLEKTEGDVNYYRATNWTPLEISLTSVPADASVGVNRSENGDEHETTINSNVVAEVVETKTQTTNEVIKMEPEVKEVKPEVKPEVNVADIRKQEGQRVSEILAIADKHGLMDAARTFIAEGKTVNEFRELALETISKNTARVANTEIGLTPKETKSYNMVKAIRALASGNWKDAGFEKAASDAVAEKLGRAAQGVFIPSEIQHRAGDPLLSVGADGHTGEKLVQTTVMSGSFIDILVNKMVIKALGCQWLTGLVGDVALPKQTGKSTAYWVTEGTNVTASMPSFGQVPMSPKTVGAYSDVSRKLLLQSSIDVERFIQMDLARSLALEIDRVCINGDSNNDEPVGIINTGSLSTVTITSHDPSFDNMIELETKVAIANADVNTCSYLTDAANRGFLKGKPKFADPYIVSGTMVWEDNMVNGYNAYCSNQVDNSIIFGDFSQLIIGMWNVLDLKVDVTTLGASGGVRVIALQDIDVAVRHIEAFSAALDVLA